MISMKILVCTSEYYPYGSGIANVAHNIVEQLNKMGVSCVVCSPNGPDIKIGRSKLIERFGIIGLLYYWYKVANYFKDNDCDVAWLHNPFFLKKNPFNKCLVTLNSTYYGKSTQKLHPLYYNILVSKIEKYCLNKIGSRAVFTVVGNSILNEMRSSGVIHKMIYIPNGVDTSIFKPVVNKKIVRDKFGLPEKNIILLSVGRLINLKQPLQLIQTFEQIQLRLENVTLVIAGSGKLLVPLKKYVSVNNIKNIIFLGHIKENLYDLYACSDFYVTASKYEGGEPTLAIAEAMSSGLVCIASNIPNFKIVETSNSGILTDFSNPKKAAEDILNYIQTNNTDNSINARKFAVQNLDWNVIAKSYLKLFSDN